MGAYERLPAADAAWLRLDGPDNRMVINALLTFRRPVTIEQVRAVVVDRLLLYPRFACRVVRRFWGPRWEPDPRFDVEFHVRPARLVPPDDPQALRQLIGQVMGLPLDRTRPPWEMLFLEDFRGGTALLVRLHHCIADGMALLRVLLSLTDPGGPVAPPREVLKRAPRPPVRRVFSGVWLAVRGLGALGHLLLLPKDHPSALKGPLSGVKRAAWSGPIPVESLRALGHRYGATVNDVLTAALAGSLREALRPRIPRGIRAIVPVDLRPGRTAAELGNFFGLVFLTLPVDLATPHERLAAVSRRMNTLKHSPQALVALQILRIVGAFVPAVARLIIWLFGRKGTLVLTNVPGPHEPRLLAGEPIAQLMFWVPQSAGVGMG
ncbi:MAG: wax ester/triacylglycerol synthase domain-containing protein, partial [Myxococcaceae bacterium]